MVLLDIALNAAIDQAGQRFAQAGAAASGWVSEGFVMAYLRGSATEDDRQATKAWLAAQPEVAEATVSALKDAWYVEH